LLLGKLKEDGPKLGLFQAKLKEDAEKLALVLEKLKEDAPKLALVLEKLKLDGPKLGLDHEKLKFGAPKLEFSAAAAPTVSCNSSTAWRGGPPSRGSARASGGRRRSCWRLGGASYFI
jgi:hypothetical protein